jgi:hypothetical protein
MALFRRKDYRGFDVERIGRFGIRVRDSRFRLSPWSEPTYYVGGGSCEIVSSRTQDDSLVDAR